MLLLGFSSGLPFYLVGNTLGYWLRDEHTSLTAIGFLSWVGIAYSLKFLWAPLIDRVDLPLFKRLGHRRGWMMFSQILVALALLAMGGTGTKAGLGRLGALALIVAFASSTCSRPTTWGRNERSAIRKQSRLTLVTNATTIKCARVSASNQ